MGGKGKGEKGKGKGERGRGGGEVGTGRGNFNYTHQDMFSSSSGANLNLRALDRNTYTIRCKGVTRKQFKLLILIAT